MHVRFFPSSFLVKLLSVTNFMAVLFMPAMLARRYVCLHIEFCELYFDPEKLTCAHVPTDILFRLSRNDTPVAIT